MDMSSSIWLRAGGGKVAIAQGALDRMSNYQQTNLQTPEAGGVLLGRMITGCDDVVVDFVTTPSASDSATRFHFRRARELTQEIIVRLWRTSSGTCNYLGEWHTHPENEPTPSSVDVQGWSELVRSASYEQDLLLFVIVGTKGLAVWAYAANWSAPVRLAPQGSLTSGSTED